MDRPLLQQKQQILLSPWASAETFRGWGDNFDKVLV